MSDSVIIKKQKIKIRTHDEALAFHMRKLLNDDLQYALIVLLDRIFTPFLPDGNMYVNIDKLAIDLGTLSATDFEQRFLELLEPKLLNEIRKRLESYNGADFRDAGQTGFQKEDDPQPMQYREKPVQELNALIYFLQYGLFPWWYRKEMHKTPAQLLEELKENESRSLVITLLSVSRRGQVEDAERMATRLFSQLAQGKFEFFINLILSVYNQQGITRGITELIKNKAELLSTFHISEHYFFGRLFRFLLSESAEESEQVMRSFFVHLKTDLQEEHETKRPEKENQRGRVKKNQPEAEGIFISNAGLVLLHPFLPALFSELGLLDPDKQFASVESQQKAAVLLYYMQSNDPLYLEWEMALNKMVCGLSIHEIIPEGILITEYEKEECLQLLQTMVNYWEALKGAGVEAVQNSFIRREGKLTHKEDSWLIQIERSGMDILLDRLPWGFGIIKFPWLEHIIYTEW